MDNLNHSIFSSFFIWLPVTVINAFMAFFTEPPSAIDNALRDLIESIRDVLPCGFPDSGIPPLSPLRVDQLPIDIEIPEAT